MFYMLTTYIIYDRIQISSKYIFSLAILESRL